MRLICGILAIFVSCLAYSRTNTSAQSADSLINGRAIVSADSVATPGSVIATEMADSIAAEMPVTVDVDADQAGDALVGEEFATDGGKFSVLGTDTIPLAVPFNKFAGYNQWEERDVVYNPEPTRAVWLSALFPGLGQVYNRRYWKLPIIVGGYLGLAYATSWNNTMLTDYTRAYRDLLDSDPETKSYMNFFPPTVSEDSLDKTWLTNILKSRRDYFRRNRDLCIISMIGVYFLAMIDAYVDASLAHFDISPDLSMDVHPTVIQDGRSRFPSVGLLWAFTF